MKRVPDRTPVAELTVGQLRATLREAIEQYAPAYGADADSAASTLEAELRDLRELVEDLQADLDRVLTRLGLEPTEPGA